MVMLAQTPVEWVRIHRCRGFPAASTGLLTRSPAPWRCRRCGSSELVAQDHLLVCVADSSYNDNYTLPIRTPEDLVSLRFVVAGAVGLKDDGCNAVRVEILSDKTISMRMLFDPGHSLEERILSEQFGY